ncbi:MULTISPECIES: hypothetical protein [Sphingomonadales]|uniref:Uncharacterized protein n=2 Tax=Edaphosphingomonas TaxID=3423724 RepID=A0A1S1H6M2_9SPHN|nr:MULTISPECIES: hypothetical protein [Sphingomonas]AGH49945.1 hypothetical protein G432_11110 [Sphingomonas sp. MM-1]MDX3883193.1 hypothetical protein [Sphingomonas sp.]OHT17737.1 hypothetical protein BHE75_04646 [Sphingomonas haloaromaticamans]OHT18303.1 hypothetical protein BHE75_00274 [Sphingomonas haloaromaticamans]PTD21992.1 hypothetical protein CV103_09415 [Sphingomonas fennica]
MAIPRPSKPSAVWRDLRAFMAGNQRHKLLIGLISVLIPALLVAGFYVDSRVDPPKPQMYFIPSWPATRSDAEIIAQQKIDQKKLDAKREAKRQEYRRLADQLGIKVD